MAHASKSSGGEAEAGEGWVWDQPELYSELYSFKQTNKTTNQTTKQVNLKQTKVSRK